MSSPWILELDKKNLHKILNENLSTEISLVGGGIAGTMSAYYILKNTNLKVTLFEAFKLSHGATGHNAGQVVAYFERPFSSIVAEFGLEMAVKAQKDILSSWDLLDEIIKETGLKIDFQKFWGYAGLRSFEDLVEKLENDFLRNQAGLDINDCLVDEDWTEGKKIPEKLKNTYKLCKKSEIQKNLQTDSKEFIACLGIKKGTLNSASFCQKIINYLLENYTQRFEVYEHSEITDIYLKKNGAVLKIKPKKYNLKVVDLVEKEYSVECKKVVLCTNGFVNFKLHNTENKDINLDQKFKENITGLIGFMAGYLEKDKLPNTAITYFVLQENKDESIQPYFYLTRRAYGEKKETLTCVGGPDLLLESGEKFDRQKDYISKELGKIDNFLHKYYKPAGENKLDYKFQWHGVIGYTGNGLRLIGPETLNKNLLYNLGCNGIGILPSIFGGWKVSQFLGNKAAEKSIFDVK